MNYFPARKCLHRYLKVAVCKKSRLSCGNLESTSITQELLVRSGVRSTNSASKLLLFSTRSTVGNSCGRHCQSEQSSNCGFNSDMKTSVLPFLQNYKLQSGLSSRAKHGGPVFSAVSGSIKSFLFSF